MPIWIYADFHETVIKHLTFFKIEIISELTVNVHPYQVIF